MFEVRASLEEKSAGLSPDCPACGSERTVQQFSPVGVITGGARPEVEPCGPSCACAEEMREA